MPQDFSGQNLRGRSFKGQDLTGANFSKADIRGADFSQANLTGANFSHARAGLQWHWVISLFSISLLISALTGFSSVLAFSSFFVFIFNAKVLLSQLYTVICVAIVVAMFVVFFMLLVQQGLEIALKVFTLPMVVIGAGSIAFVGAVASAIGGLGSASSAIGIAAAATGALVGLGSGSIAVAAMATMAGFLAEAKTLSIAVTGIVAVAGVLAGGLMAMAVGMPQLYAGTVPVVFLASYISWRTLIEDEKFTLIQTIAVAIAATRGTSFKCANLTDANFSGAILKSTDLTNAICTRTCWFQAKKLERARLKDTYLLKPMLRSVVITGEGINKNFDSLSLRGVNLSGASLVDASFIGTDLSHANLQDANLSRAKLVQTQLDGTDFTDATLTGAYIEDWNITTDTKFDGVRCEYVYMRLPTSDNPEPHRKPDNRQEVFADGEFGDFIKPIFDTLDLYHNQGVDPRAIAISFKRLAENNPDAELEIVAMEKRGLDKFLLRAKSAIAADKSQLSAEYFDTYNQLKNLPDREIKLLLAEKENQIRRLENMVMTALERPSFYSNVEQVGFMTNNPGGFSVGGSVSGDINNVQGDNNQQRVSNKTSNFNLQNAQFAGGLVNADTVNAGQIGGNITNYNPEQKQNLAEAAAEIQQLLNQLSQTYPTVTTSEKMSVVAKAVDEIESNPTLKARVIGALKAGGTEAFKELIDHPLVNILLASIEGWQEAE
ncbi:MAG: pentapeptide repeat-containing protein [Nostoc sp. ChiSLP01]